MIVGIILIFAVWIFFDHVLPYLQRQNKIYNLERDLGMNECYVCGSGTWTNLCSAHKPQE